MIDQLLKHHKIILIRKLLYNKEVDTFLYKRLPFIGNTSYKVKNILQTENIKSVFYSPYTLKSSMVNNQLIKKKY